MASLLPSVAPTQDDVDLIVTLRDVAGLGVANVQVIVRDVTGERDLVRAATDADGVAAIRGIVISDIRVAVVGTLPGGQRLLLRGDDARGIHVFLGAGATGIALRVENDGTVIPDPSEIVQEMTQLDDTPAALSSGLAASIDAPTLPAQPFVVPVGTLEPRQPEVDAPQDGGLLPFILMAVFGGLIVAVVVVGRRV